MSWLSTWQDLPYRINPVFLEIGPFQIRYYGLMYVIGFLTVYLLVRHRMKKETFALSEEVVQGFWVWAVLAVLIGGRLGYALVYDVSPHEKNLMDLLNPFSNGRFIGWSGMSYHGALAALVFVSFVYTRVRNIGFLEAGDLFSPAIPLGYTFGRLGNFLNGELYGRITERPWGMFFPLDPNHSLRHPSQLYEAFFEGVFLFGVLWALRKRRPFKGFHLALYLVGYALARFICEFFREPDPQLGLFLDLLTMGQILSVLMFAAGLFLFLWLPFKKNP